MQSEFVHVCKSTTIARSETLEDAKGDLGVVVVAIILQLDLQLSVKSAPITTKVVR